MKNLKQIGLIALALVFLVSVISFADTARLGSSSYSFNATRSVYKTAAYTLTTSDSLVNFTASSANIVATLPSVSSALAGGTLKYKIVKKDATAYKIVVTPASGDTIGGESTRYILGDESFIVITAGPGKDWTVEYESPYIVEDHEAGTYTTGIGSGGLYSAKTASYTVTASDCGNIITATTGTLTFTLPATVANCKLTFINAVGGAGALKIDPNDADQIFGGCTLAASVVSIAGAAGDSITNTTGTAVKGDTVTLIGDGTDGWFIQGCQGIWADTN